MYEYVNYLSYKNLFLLVKGDNLRCFLIEKYRGSLFMVSEDDKKLCILVVKYLFSISI